ncbi:MAG: DNA-binding protein [Thermobacillus sp. ZCTH02-B1]|uniref:helix-turn-helix transcriptional regulator n=1 Tax=Thermobacillus sp. ZCTH02-B1 TaxID=1858795 RepID=UPI000B57DB88|nr:helix-turn-helix transcriptional regulator [Thermobacillus sp. ZCTH02-B1]OUM96309.1 MAG: DNA-binding protein [Thermobacillus sp. ZCTH02-B1]
MKNRLPEYRKKHNLSQDKLAEMLNVTRQTIISIEKGKYNPSLPLAIRIARIFHASVEEIFILDEEE